MVWDYGEGCPWPRHKDSGGGEAQLQSFLTSLLDGGAWLSRPGRFNFPRKNCNISLIRGWVGLRVAAGNRTPDRPNSVIVTVLTELNKYHLLIYKLRIAVLQEFKWIYDLSGTDTHVLRVSRRCLLLICLFLSNDVFVSYCIKFPERLCRLPSWYLTPDIWNGIPT